MSNTLKDIASTPLEGKGVLYWACSMCGDVQMRSAAGLFKDVGIKTTDKYHCKCCNTSTQSILVLRDE